MKSYLVILTLFFCSLTFAQTAITGVVSDAKKQPIPGANVKIAGASNSASTDVDGKFTLKAVNMPCQLEISSVGYAPQTVSVSSASQAISVSLKDEETQLNEIVVSASRTPERVLESPVTIERMGLAQIKNTTAATYYDGLENLKEVHFNTSSFSFKSINTRGFATVSNTRFMQLVDGMDNSSPALNFVLGNLIGISELDVASVELLPGASSALYGANAFNGILFMNSKSPFTSPGLSTYFKYGQTSQEAAGVNDYFDAGIRAAHVFNKNFAAKANFTFMKATEWIANDRRNVVGGGLYSDPSNIGHDVNQNYDGLNSYGDEVSTFIPNVGQVSRTGYLEKDLNDNNIKNVKADFSLHFKPFDNDFEIILQSKFGTGNTIYQGANRYALKNFYMNQNRIEVKGKNFFARAYMTEEDAGDSYDMRFAAWNVNRASKPDTNWFTDYATAYQLSSAVLGLTANAASNYARTFADTNVSPILNLTPYVNPENPLAPTLPRFLAGSPEYKNALNTIVKDADFTKGAKFTDHSKIYHSDVNYNLRDFIKVADVQVGGSYRQYVMDSEGSIFTDYDAPITYTELGMYTQVQKKLMDDRLKFTGSIRYDKSKNFDGSFSPRLAFVYSAGANKNHNIRVSYQTGFRNPTTQDQYIGLDLGPFALIGSAPENLTRFVEIRKNGENGVTISPEGQIILGGNSVTLNGVSAYTNSYTSTSVAAFAAAPKTTDAEKQAAANLLQVASPGLVKPEQVQAVELGYRSSIEDVSIDINGYYNMYTDMLNTANVITPYYGNVNVPINIGDDTTKAPFTALSNGDRRVYQVYTNSKASLDSYGFGIGLGKKIFGNYEVSANYNFSDFIFDETKDPGFESSFNTPKHRIKASLGNPRLFKNFGFNTNVRWNTAYTWQSSFVDGDVPENTVVDAQITYGIPSMKSVLKLGANNLMGKDYIQVVGAGAIGQLWYASWTINP
ncbi:MAG: carboxypeptidase-like regulatory domain-containing protein [Flavobacterium sp.]|nr:carboxypeptidase-like regulatory domain-containing protein [Flavobacterium sp.]